MERRFRVRLDELLAEAAVAPGVLRGMRPRRQRFLEPFVGCRTEARGTPAPHDVAGLVSDRGRKNAEGIASLHDQERQGLQKFLGQAPWDERPLRTELARQVAAELGEADGVLVLDPSAFPPQGTASVGVQRPGCGRLGKVANGQVGIYRAYASRVEHALVDGRRYLPREGAADQDRRTKAGVPKAVRFRTRPQLALERLAVQGPVLPHAWVTGDEARGRCSGSRQQLRQRGACYLRAVPSPTAVRDRAAAPPPYQGRGPRPKAPFVRGGRGAAALPEAAWPTIAVRDGEKGPLAVPAAWGLVQARTEGRVANLAEVVVVFRERQADGTCKQDYLLSQAPLTTPVAEYARGFQAEHRVEDALRRATSEAGLGPYQVRTWAGWHHPQARALVAAWFLTQETRRGKKIPAGVDGAAGALGGSAVAAARVGG